MLTSLVNLILFITFATLIVTFHFDGAKIQTFTNITNIFI
uniref:Uncharacterized protein n=1 Tax=Siphoviridae sp. ctvod4 TaxID=2827595 RepID=A0A8S5LKZ9_9CAUD|nr:MAG TPA: hypothetical protein [Siphoviridae sp. ctvod4]